jgi:hypothetical protein
VKKCPFSIDLKEKKPNSRDSYKIFSQGGKYRQKIFQQKPASRDIRYDGFSGEASGRNRIGFPAKFQDITTNR